jgi:hypothetical protein
MGIAVLHVLHDGQLQLADTLKHPDVSTLATGNKKGDSLAAR